MEQSESSLIKQLQRCVLWLTALAIAFIFGMNTHVEPVAEDLVIVKPSSSQGTRVVAANPVYFKIKFVQKQDGVVNCLKALRTSQYPRPMRSIRVKNCGEHPLRLWLRASYENTPDKVVVLNQGSGQWVTLDHRHKRIKVDLFNLQGEPLGWVKLTLTRK